MVAINLDFNNMRKKTMYLRSLLTVALFAISSATWAAESESVSGVVTNVNANAQTITIRNTNTGQRRTYFLNRSTRVSSNGNAVTLSSIRKGNEVTVRYRSTDTGRVIETLGLPNPSKVVEVTPTQSTDVMTVTGRVTGVQPSKRTLTIRDDETRTRRTLKVPETTKITRDGEVLVLRDIERGDNISARYQVTDSGLILVTGRASTPAAESAAAVPVALPKTAGHLFAYLFMGLGLLGSGIFVRLIRKRG
jgi:hypothetical protein